MTPALIADLESRGLLFREQVYEHAYPHCWRCGTPLLYYAKSSWYVRTSRGEGRSCSPTTRRSAGTPSTSSTAASATGWRTTSTGRSRATATGARRCRSGECGDAGCDGRFCAGSVAELRERASGEVPDDLHRPYIDEVTLDCARVRRRDAPGRVGDRRLVRQRRDALRAVPLPVRERELFEERFPADFICEAIDQTRGWFYTLLAESTLLFDTSSYRNCVCLGLILDPEGQKMSKSKGNVVEPWDVIAAHGADAFRWYYLTAQQPWSGYRFSVETVGESVRQFLLTLWNTYSFWVLYANAEGLGAERNFAVLPLRGQRRDDLDRWVLSRLQATVATCASGWTTSTARRRGGRSPSSSRSSPTGTCGSRAAASGTATAPPSRPCATACWRRRRCSPPSPPSSPTRSTSTWPAARPRSWASCPTRSTCATSRSPTRRCRPRAGGGDGGGPPHASSSAAPPAPRPRRRSASRCAAP